MVKSQPEIKKDVIPHPLRNIQIIFEPGKTTTTRQDKQLINSFIKLHDFEVHLQKAADKLFKECSSINKRVEALRKRLGDVQKTFNTCSDLADKLSDASFDATEVNLEKLTQSQLDTNAEIQSYHLAIVELYEKISVVEKEIDDYNLADEDESNEMFDKHQELASKHSANWEKNNINIVDYDEEYDDFLTCRGVNNDHRKSLMEYCDSALNNYTKLHLENVSLYNVWTEFMKRCDLIRAVAALHSGVLSINNN